MIKKIAIIGVIALMVTLIVAAVAVACVVYRHCGRPQYWGERKALLLKNKEILLQNHGAERFTCTTHDNLMLSGLIIKRPQARRIILLCHGYNRSKEFMLPVVEMFPNDTLVLFDFRAHGESEGNIVSFSIHESSDIHAVIEHVVTQYGLQKLPLCALGVSMGAASLVKAAHEGAPFKALVLDSSFAVFVEQLDRSWNKKTWLPKFLLWITSWFHELLMGASVHKATPKHMISRIAVPVYIIHADEDWFVSSRDARALYTAAQGTKHLWIVKSTQHARNFTENPQEYKQRVDEFFDSVTL
jgi:pimeloyl-ACP methyl ester carboxylesterase